MASTTGARAENAAKLAVGGQNVLYTCSDRMDLLRRASACYRWGP